MLECFLTSTTCKNVRQNLIPLATVYSDPMAASGIKCSSFKLLCQHRRPKWSSTCSTAEALQQCCIAAAPPRVQPVPNCHFMKCAYHEVILHMI